MQLTETATETQPTDQVFSLVASDGFPLGACLFEPESALGTVVVNPATAAPQRYYAAFAEYLSGRGLRVLTFDYRGIGRSRPSTLRGFDVTMTQWAAQDVASAYRFVREQYPGEPIAIVGHSFGAQSVGLVDELRGADAAVFFGAQLGYYGHWDGLERLGLGALWHGVVPALTSVYGYLPGRFGLGEDLPFGVAREWARWCSTRQYLASDHPDALARFAAFRVPTLAFTASDDRLAPRTAVQALLRLLPSDTVTHRELRPGTYGGDSIGHFGFFRKRFAPTVWSEAADFLRGAFLGADGGPRAASAVARATAEPFLEDIMADLAYGR